VHGHDRLAFVALDDDVGALLSRLDAATPPKKPEQVLAGQTFIKCRVAGRCVKSIDDSKPSHWRGKSGRDVRKGLFINCEKAQITGISYDGGYAEYVVVPHEAIARIPEKLSAIDAGPILCAGVTTYNALRNSGARPGDTVAVQGIGGLGHFGLQYASKMGFRTIAISHGKDKEELARQLGAHEYVDTNAGSAAEGLNRLGGADVVLATAPYADAIADTAGGLKPRGKLLIVAAPFEPLKVSVMGLLTGKTIAGWPSGSAIDSEEALAFSALTGVAPRVEVFKLDQAELAFTKVMENRVRFRAVLVP